MKKSSLLAFMSILLFSLSLWSETLGSKRVIRTAPVTNSCKSFYYGGLAVLDTQDNLVKQVERAHLKRLADFRRVYYHFENYMNSLSKEKRESILAYKGTAFGDVNRFLRKRPSTFRDDEVVKIKNLIDLIDSAIDKGPSIPKNIVLFRGMSVKKTSSNAFAAAKKGDIINDKAFTSTSLSVRTAMNFIHMHSMTNDRDSLGILQVIHIKEANRRGLYIEGQSIESESEVLIDRDSHYRIIATQRIVIENKIEFDPMSPIINDDLVTSGAPPVLGGILFPSGEPINFKNEMDQLSLFTPEELPIPNIITSWGQGNGDFGLIDQHPQVADILVQHIELIQDRKDL